MWVLWVVLAWMVVGLVAAILLGRSIRLADEMEAAEKQMWLENNEAEESRASGQ